MKVWEIEHSGHQIRVENSWSGSEKLIVDGELQDERMGLCTRSRLYGQIKSGSSQGENIKVSLGGWFSIGCRIFIDDKLVLSQ